MVTNIGKTKAEIILDLIMSLNAGDSSYVAPASHRIDLAIEQYNQLVKAGIIEEAEHTQEYNYTSKYTVDPGGFVPPPSVYSGRK